MTLAPELAGALLFSRYAFRPNQLGYCGGSTPEALLEAGSGQSAEPGEHLRAVCGEFEGAYPYLQLIAASGGIADPLDPRVVEAYWVGSPLLDRVKVGLFGASLDARFGDRAREWRWLAGKPAAGGIPHHAFHVLEVFPRVGLMRSGEVPALLETMTSCLVRPATVVSRQGSQLVVEALAVELRDGKLAMSAPRTETVLASCEGASFVSDAGPGDSVAIHWGWACEILSPMRRGHLERAIARSMALANTTF